ncbi:MAG: hypothetical protein GWP10_05255 [Nitrospiraceae bacterium]|nr:hypothetical protein [Nitrospiraceae bacterium]
MYTKLKTTLIDSVKENKLIESNINIVAKILTPKEAIGEPERLDFPLLQGKESLIQANFDGASGQAFTDTPKNFRGKIKDILDLKLTNNGSRALFTATLNAVMRSLGRVDRTIHCKNEEPELCAKEIARTIIDRYGPHIKVGIVGFQPAIIDNFCKRLPLQDIKVTDLDRDNINKIKYGLPVWDGNKKVKELFRASDVVLATSSTVVNGTMPRLLSLSESYQRPIYFYGITGAGPAEILGLKRLCFKSS